MNPLNWFIWMLLMTYAGRFLLQDAEEREAQRAVETKPVGPTPPVVARKVIARKVDPVPLVVALDLTPGDLDPNRVLH